jgi:DNA polymerase/3'-5' exonuclease PolX
MNNLKVCPEGKEINPKTGRCIKKCATNEVRNMDTGKCKKTCPEGKEINPKTGRCVNMKKKANIIEINHKKELIKNFKILEEYEILNKQPFKARAYNKVINSFELYDDKINNIDDTENINGVGEKIKDKIKQYFQTGKIDGVEKALNDPKFTLQRKLSKLYGVGPVKIKELMTKINSFEDLKNNPDILNDKQKIGLKYYDDLLERIPIEEGQKHYGLIDKIFKKTYNNIEFELVGSYRRKNKDLGDIDVLIKNQEDINLKILIKELNDAGYIIETLANGKNKFMGICRISPDSPARRIDILIADPSYYYFALLYFTGSYSFNIYMRRIALQKNISLSEYGFKDKNNKIIDTSNIIKSEKDIFDYLDIPYVSPDNRDNYE